MSIRRRLIAILLLLATGPFADAAPAPREALIIPIDGAIGAATGEFVVSGIEDAAAADAELVVLRMDTPGGLDQAMRRVIKAILASPVPVASFVAPSGARALLALYALQVLPVNYAGVGLILLGILLMVGEALAPSFGALGLGGFAAFLFGSVILMDERDVAVSWPVIGITAGLSAALSIWVIGRFIGLRRQTSAVGPEHLVGEIGEARADFGGTSNEAGLVHLEGELWQASSPSPVRRGESVRVHAVKGLTLEVAPISSSPESSVNQSPVQSSANQSPAQSAGPIDGVTHGL